MFKKDKQQSTESKLREVRRAHRITQDELAIRVGVTRQTIISVEKGNYTPSVLLALKLAAALECTVEELFYYESI